MMAAGRRGRIAAPTALARTVRILVPLALLLSASCVHQPVKPAMPAVSPKKPAPAVPGPALVPASWKDLGGFEDDLGFGGLAQACRASLSYFQKLPPSTTFDFGGKAFTAMQLEASTSALLAIAEDPSLGPAQKAARVRREFTLFKSIGSDGAGAVLVTGYYEPWLEGRRTPDARFTIPIYHKPEDMLTVDLSLFPAAKSQARIVGRAQGDEVVPYFTRGEIAAGALAGKGIELLWLEDPVDLFFLQVQGSGKVTLEDGTEVRVQYDAQNGLPYRSLGKVLIDLGVLPADQVSMQAIRAYFKDHPDKLPLLNQNASYTFFRLEKDGPYGSTGAILTPGRSIATDAKVFPKGAPALLRSRKPVLDARGQVRGWEPFSRLVLNQDTGGAITGPGRVDLFWGGGPMAEAGAGRMKEPGEIYFLLKN